MRQFSLFAWTHVALLIVVTQSYLIIQNMFEVNIFRFYSAKSEWGISFKECSIKVTCSKMQNLHLLVSLWRFTFLLGPNLVYYAYYDGGNQ